MGALEFVVLGHAHRQPRMAHKHWLAVLVSFACHHTTAICTNTEVTTPALASFHGCCHTSTEAVSAIAATVPCVAFAAISIAAILFLLLLLLLPLTVFI